VAARERQTEVLRGGIGAAHAAAAPAVGRDPRNPAERAHPCGRWLARLRYGRVWSDPYRVQRSLLSFSETEEDSGKDLVRASQRVADAELRAHFVRHSADELRHAELFRARAAEVAAEHGLPAGTPTERPFELHRARPGVELNAHGFFSAGLIDELGELEYVAMLHVAEARAAALFAALRYAIPADHRTRAVFDEILRDEKYHVAYTGRFLERWRAEGRGREVDAALRAAAGERLLGGWRRFGARSASRTSSAVLSLSYWTIAAPFGLVARGLGRPSGWRRPRASPPSSQY
jgi:hypothetical protein